MIFDWIRKQNFNSASIIFEIGAHFGLDTEKIYEASNKAKIYAFEPDPRNIEVLKQREVNKIATIIPMAVGNKKDNAVLYKTKFYLSSGEVHTGNEILDKNDWSASSSLKKPVKHLEHYPWCKFEKEIEVDVVTLDFICQCKGVEHIDFIWSDLQGGEDLFIEGAKEILKNTRYLYTEYYDLEMYEGQISLETILKLLQGWSIVFVDGNNVLLKNDLCSLK